MSGNASDRSQQGALGRLRMLQVTAEFLHQTFPSLWAEPEFPGPTRDRRAAADAPSRFGVPPAADGRDPRHEAAYYRERAHPIPGASPRADGRERRELPPSFRGTYDNRQIHTNGNTNGHPPVYNGNGVPLENGYHVEDYQESDGPRENDNGNGHRRRSE